MITPRVLFVLLFNAGTENEGIHTIIGDAGSALPGQDAIRYIFESEDDATACCHAGGAGFPLPQ